MKFLLTQFGMRPEIDGSPAGGGNRINVPKARKSILSTLFRRRFISGFEHYNYVLTFEIKT